MADPTLPTAQQKLGEKVLSALSAVKMPVASHEWKYVPQIEGYELVVTTPWVKDKGLETTNWALLNALEMAHISESTRFVRFIAPS